MVVGIEPGSPLVGPYPTIRSPFRLPWLPGTAIASLPAIPVERNPFPHLRKIADQGRNEGRAWQVAALPHDGGEANGLATVPGRGGRS